MPTASCPAAAAASHPPEWIMLDRVPVWRELENGTTAILGTSSGLDVRVSLRLAAPPATSYVHLHAPQIPVSAIEENSYGESVVVAADAGLLLLIIAVPVQHVPRRGYPEEYFVYKADPVRPSLQRLPPLDDDWKPHTGDAGVACRGEEFVVAVFHTFLIRGKASNGRFQEVTKLARWSSVREEKEWEVTELAMPYHAPEGLEPFLWETDSVLSFAGTMCWIDYALGILMCNVFDKMPELHFVPFPIHGMKVNSDLDVVDDFRGLSESYRTVGVNSDGQLKFVEVDNCRLMTSGYSVTTWKLCAPEMIWEKDSVLDIDHLWATDFQDARLPHSVPAFPTVSRQEPDVVHFVLPGPGRFSKRVWMISVNMRSKTLLSYVRYKNSREDGIAEKHDLDKGLFFNDSFLCSDLPKCVKELSVCSDCKDGHWFLLMRLQVRLYVWVGFPLCSSHHADACGGSIVQFQSMVLG